MPTLKHVEDEAEFMRNARLVALCNLGKFTDQGVQVGLDLEILWFENRSKLRTLCAYCGVHFDQSNSSITVSHKEDGR